tara:strand:- start:13731 stop:14075 length:345 start_codon:yes stop_codon:yes gene_type:complete
MKYNSDFKYDLLVGQVKEKELSDIFSNKKIEVKYDLKATETGNVFVEYESRGQKSGISKSQADYYCFAFGSSLHLLPTKVLKDKCRKYIGSNRDVKGGDNNTSSGILLPIKELL